MTATLAARTLHHVAPGDLLLERNIRDSVPSPDLVSSVKALGVLEPITAVTNADGAPVVRFGHRRTLAAIEAGLETVPVYIAVDDSTDDDAEVARIVSQRDENTQRTGLSTADEVGVVEQLAAFGLSAGQMVEQARLSKDTVDTALAVSGSKLARKATDRYEALTLDQAAVVAEFEQDPEIAKELIVTAVEDPTRFAHMAQCRRDDRTRAQLITDARDKLAAAGIKILNERPGYSDKAKALYHLVDTETGKNVTDKAHVKCPGHAVHLIAYAGDGKVVEEVYCTDPKKNGHRDRYGSSRTPAADMSAKEREAAKKARALVIEHNKAWQSALTVRREWLAVFAKLKTPPKGAGAFLAGAFAHDLSQLTIDYKNDHQKLVTEWLGGKSPEALAKTATDGRALVIALVQLIARYEGGLGKDDWRHDGTTHRVGRYLRFLESAGYGLSDVEKYAISKKTV